LQGTNSIIKHQEISHALFAARHNQILDIFQRKWNSPVLSADVLDQIKGLPLSSKAR
jgi:hypothetical protein